MQRKTIIKIHTALAAFFLPMGIVYAVTGGLYTWGITGKYDRQDVTLELAEPLPAELSALVALAEREVQARGLDVPTGKAGIKKSGTSFHFEWTGSRRDIQIHPTAEPNRAVLRLMDTTPHRFFVQLHKAKGGNAFKVFAAMWAVGLVGLFLSGGAIAFLAKPYRRLATLSAGAGVVCFVLFAWFS